MLKTLIPQFKFWKSAPAGETSYPNLQDDAEGISIPEAYGVLKNITPICIDTTTGKYKVARRAIKAIDEVRDNGRVLATAEYTTTAPELALGEFGILTTSLLTGGATYYLILESDYAINGTDYLKYWQDNHGHYGSFWYSIDSESGVPGNWTVQTNKNLEFQLYGRTAIDGKDTLLVDAVNWTGWGAGIKLRDAAARTRVAQKFIMPAGGPWYLSKIKIYSGSPAGSPSSARITKVQIVTVANPAATPAIEVPVGMKSEQVVNGYVGPSGWKVDQNPKWLMRAGGSNDLRVDIQGYMINPPGDTTLIEKVADVLQDIYVNILGGSATGINAVDLGTLRTDRVQDVVRYMTEEKEFQQVLEIFEAGHLFKFLPSLAGDFAVKLLVSGEPGGTPHLTEVQVKNFTMRRVWSNVFQVAKIKYYLDSSTNDFLTAEEKSTIAQYLYNRQESIEIETALKDAADATQLAKDYLGTGGGTRKVNLQYPTRIAEFDVLAGYGFDLIPTMKVKLTLPRADYAGGSLAGILFRILEVHKNPMDGTSHLVTVLDSLTY